MLTQYALLHEKTLELLHDNFLRPIVKFFKGCGDEVPATLEKFKPLPIFKGGVWGGHTFKK